jgi:DNA-binding MarR family transcriptional regulator
MRDLELDRLLVAIGRKMQSVLRRHLPRELTLTQTWVLGLLYEQGPVPLSDVAKHVDLSLSAASVVVDQLMHMGWAAKGRSATDRRALSISLTAKGKAAVEDAIHRRQDVLETLLAQMSPEEVRVLEESLTKFEALLVHSFGTEGQAPSKEETGVGP